MLEFNSPIGRKIKRRLREEQIIWLTTVDSHIIPQPRPVWFHWDGSDILILSQTRAAKVRHIIRNPKVALNFNTDSRGEEVGVMIGEARLQPEALPANRMKNYIRKYRQGFQDIGLTVAEMQAEYPVIILVRLLSLRG
jgi:PPOX class probable F420-dependent enzyme